MSKAVMSVVRWGLASAITLLLVTLYVLTVALFYTLSKDHRPVIGSWREVFEAVELLWTDFFPETVE